MAAGFLVGLFFVCLIFILPVHLLAEIERLKRRIRRLEDSPRPAAPAEEIAQPAAPEPTAPPAVEAAAPPAPEATPPPAPTPAAPPAVRLDWETILGARWLHWAGMLVLVLGAGFFLKYAFDNRWINETARVLIGLAAGALFLAAGERIRDRYRIFALGLLGLAVALFYLSVYAAHAFYHLVPFAAAFALMVVVTALSATMTVSYGSLFLAVVSVAGGFLTPVVLRTPAPVPAAFFVYLFVLNAGVAALGTVRDWRCLQGISLALTAVVFNGWLDRFPAAGTLPALVFAAAVFLLFLAVPLANAVRGRARESDFFVAVADAAFAMLFLFRLLGDRFADLRGPAAVLLAAVHTGAGLFLRRKIGGGNLALAFLGLALVFLTTAIPLQLAGPAIPVAWAGEAFVLTWLGIRAGSRPARLAAFALFVMALFRLAAFDADVAIAGFVPIANLRFFAFAATAAAMFVAARLLAVENPGKTEEDAAMSTVLVVLGVFTLFFLASREAVDGARASAYARTGAPGSSFLERSILTLAWTGYAGVLFVVGMAARLRTLRRCALVLFGLTLAKVLLADLFFVHTFYRVVVFLALGGVLLLVSFAYHRSGSPPGKAVP